jgi:hypothetical protein
VLLNIDDALENNIDLLEKLSIFITSTALTSASTFPNVTLPQFNTLTEQTQGGVGGFLAEIYAPLITQQERAPWEQYSLETKWWLNLTEYRGHDENDVSRESDQEQEVNQIEHEIEETDVSTFIYNWVDEEKVEVPKNETGLYAPIWHVSPLHLSAINHNIFGFPPIAHLYTDMRATGHTVMSGAIEIENLFDFADEEEHKSNTDKPHSVVLEPVYDRLSDDQTIVGMLAALLPYDSFFSFYLPDNTKGIVIVFSETCGSTFTYEMSGSNATFLGYEDLHDPTYNRYQRTTLLKIRKQGLTEFCHSEVRVYPSSMFQNAYSTNKPVLYTCIVAFSFLLMAMLILVYDFTVTRRQEKTMKSALRSGKLISSLFPANVRERLMNDVATDKEGEKNSTSIGIDGVERSRPIADFFANTTIMCAFERYCSFHPWLNHPLTE